LRQSIEFLLDGFEPLPVIDVNSLGKDSKPWQRTPVSLARLATLPESDFRRSAGIACNLLLGDNVPVSSMPKASAAGSPAPLKAEGLARSIVVFKLMLWGLALVSSYCFGSGHATAGWRLILLNLISGVVSTWLAQLALLVWSNANWKRPRPRDVAFIRSLVHMGRWWLLSFLPRAWRNGYEKTLRRSIRRRAPGPVLAGIVIDDSIADLIHFDPGPKVIYARDEIRHYRTYVQVFFMIHEVWGHALIYWLTGGRTSGGSRRLHRLAYVLSNSPAVIFILVTSRFGWTEGLLCLLGVIVSWVITIWYWSALHGTNPKALIRCSEGRSAA
jgi:hypothetical protein